MGHATKTLGNARTTGAKVRKPGNPYRGWQKADPYQFYPLTRTGTQDSRRQAQGRHFSSKPHWDAWTQRKKKEAKNLDACGRTVKVTVSISLLKPRRPIDCEFTREIKDFMIC